MRITHLTRTVRPYGTDGVVFRAAAALPEAQAAAGHDVSVIAPAPVHDIDQVQPNQGLARRLSPLEVPGDPALKVELLEGQLAGSRARLYLLVFPEGADQPEAFGRACVALMQGFAQPPELVHLHQDTGADADAIRDALDGPAVVASVYDASGEEPSVLAAIQDADAVLAPCQGLWLTDADPSPAVAQALASLPKVHVTPPALDSQRWSPARDGALEATYSGDDLQGKAACRAALVREAGLPPRDDVLLLAVWGRDGDAGDGLALGEALSELLSLDVQLVLLPPERGDQAWIDGLRERSGVWVAPDAKEPTLRRVLSGADAVLLPDDAAPLGERALIALRYGLVVVARRVHTHRELLVEYDAQSRSGGAFLFDGAHDCYQAVHRMVRAFRDGDDWTPMVQANVQVESSWERSLAHLEQVYQKALAR